MKCLSCSKNIVVKKTLSTLFNTSKQTICAVCYKEYKIELKTIILPTSLYKVIVIYLFDKFVNPSYFLYDISILIKKLLKDDIFFIYVDNLNINNYFENMIEIVTKLEQKDIYLLTVYVNN